MRKAGLQWGRRRWTVAAAVGAATLAGVLAWRAFGPGEPLPAPLRGLDARGAVALANEWAARGESVESFVTTEAVHFRWPDGRQAAVPLPAQSMYVAVAPYLEHTHPCTVHYISSCRAELAGVPFVVTARTADGRVVLQQTLTSLPNGFVELWLPRGMDLVLTVEWPEARLVGQGRIVTGADAPTCVTDIRLARAG
ncbi:MAG TPA: CueP family metal-binding protein [Limnochordales bacterium]